MEKISLLKYHHSGRDNLNEKRHFHDSEFEILHILSGTGTMMIKDKLYSLSPNTIFFISGSDAHCSMPDVPSSYMRNKINFSKDLLMSTAAHFDCTQVVDKLFSAGGSAVKLSLGTSLEIDKCFLRMSEIFQEKSDITALKLFTEIFSVMDAVLADSRKSVPYVKNKISDVIEYINKNIEKKLTLDIISQDTNISKYYLCHSFCDAVGMTVFEYIEFIRISRAKQLLTETDESVSCIASRTGYDSCAYFSKVFKNNENITPTEYRKKYFCDKRQ